MSAWLAVVSADHVARGVELGIVQVNHGKRGGLARMHIGDTVIYYSPREGIRDGAVVKAFTAIGTIPDDEIYQDDAVMGAGSDVRPFRRRLDYETDARRVPVADLALELTAKPHWGYSLRLGLVPLSDTDAATIRAAMLA